ncbi:MAG: V-type ATP synthase subunit E family protein [Corallococcus sp.]|nr:V-type ATP synthase subunit E family protein [Corallococcus sp.]
MEGKSKIIARIMEDAEEKCQEISANAQQRADAIIAKAEDKIAAETHALDERISAVKSELNRTKSANAKLDARKYKLAQKQRLIETCYTEAIAKVGALSEAKYRDFLKKLIEQNAETGEKVAVSEKDAKIVTQKFLDGFGKKLTLSSCKLNSAGGLVLEGDGYDKDLTVEALISEVRNDTESVVASILFGDDK